MPWGAADEAAPPRRGQRYKSPAELDFYGEFYAALCGAPALPVLPSAKDGRGLRPAGARKGTRKRAFFDILLRYMDFMDEKRRRKTDRMLLFSGSGRGKT